MGMTIIKNYGMPHNCYDCDLHNYHECDLTGESIEEDYCWNGDSREKHCPLREVEAIEALEQEPTTKNNLGVDCISRAEAIKCLECDFDITGKENMKTVVNYINSAHDKIVNLPSVTPQESVKKLEEQIKQLQNRCHAFTHGQICVFCLYDCEHKAESEG